MQLTTHFNAREFACKCGCGTGEINADLTTRLQLIRDVYGKPMTVTSGIRCDEHNRRIGGASQSAHVTGEAADILCRNGNDRHRLISMAYGAGFKRIGVHKDFVHLDVSGTLSSPSFWLY